MAIFPARIYKINTDQDIEWFYSRLMTNNYFDDKIIKDGKEYLLATVVKDLEWSENEDYFGGTLAYHQLRFDYDLEGNKIASTTANFAPFVFKRGSVFVIFFASKETSTTASNKLTKMLGGTNVIREINFDERDIEDFLAQNPFNYKYCTWNELRIPGLDRANLGGGEITKSPDFHRFESLGIKNYLMIELINEGHTITLSRYGAIGFVTSITKEDALNFIDRKIFPFLWAY